MHRYFQKNGFVIKFEFKREDAIFRIVKDLVYLNENNFYIFLTYIFDVFIEYNNMIMKIYF